MPALRLPLEASRVFIGGEAAPHQSQHSSRQRATNSRRTTNLFARTPPPLCSSSQPQWTDRQPRNYSGLRETPRHSTESRTHAANLQHLALRAPRRRRHYLPLLPLLAFASQQPPIATPAATASFRELQPQAPAAAPPPITALPQPRRRHPGEGLLGVSRNPPNRALPSLTRPYRRLHRPATDTAKRRSGLCGCTRRIPSPTSSTTAKINASSTTPSAEPFLPQLHLSGGHWDRSLQIIKSGDFVLIEVGSQRRRHQPRRRTHPRRSASL